jgi:uncharacterized membrane protein
MELSTNKTLGDIEVKLESFLQRFDRHGESQFVRIYSGRDAAMAALSYFPFACTAILLFRRKTNSDFVSFHSHQSLVILVIALLGILFLPGPAKLIVFITAYTLLAYGAYMAMRGRKWYLPIVTELANTINL